MPASVLACAALTASIVAKPAARNALLVGANTVRILPPDKMAATFVIQVLAFITAVTRKINVVSAEAISTMSPSRGSNTFRNGMYNTVAGRFIRCNHIDTIYKNAHCIFGYKHRISTSGNYFCFRPVGTSASITFEPHV